MITKNALEKVEVTKNETDVFQVFKEVCLHFDIEQSALAIFFGEKRINSSFLVYNTYPIEWEKHYIKNQYHLHDPIFEEFRKISHPFEWHTQGFSKLSKIQKKLLDESYDFGVKFGVTIPLIPYTAFHGFVTALNQPMPQFEVLHTLSVVGNVCTNKIVQLKNMKSATIDIFHTKGDKDVA